MEQIELYTWTLFYIFNPVIVDTVVSDASRVASGRSLLASTLVRRLEA